MGRVREEKWKGEGEKWKGEGGRKEEGKELDFDDMRRLSDLLHDGREIMISDPFVVKTTKSRENVLGCLFVCVWSGLVLILFCLCCVAL
jgi:hypothetical protein